MKTHTPGTALPWSLKHKTTIERPVTVREHVAICPVGGPSIAYLPAGRDSRVDLQLANADFIVTACNSHADLVAFVKHASRDWRSEGNGIVPSSLAKLAQKIIETHGLE